MDGVIPKRSEILKLNIILYIYYPFVNYTIYALFLACIVLFTFAIRLIIHLIYICDILFHIFFRKINITQGSI